MQAAGTGGTGEVTKNVQNASKSVHAHAQIRTESALLRGGYA